MWRRYLPSVPAQPKALKSPPKKGIQSSLVESPQRYLKPGTVINCAKILGINRTLIYKFYYHRCRLSKNLIVRAINPHWQNFIGGYPIAGKSDCGRLHKESSLFFDRPYALTLADTTPWSIVEVMSELVG